MKTGDDDDDNLATQNPTISDAGNCNSRVSRATEWFLIIVVICLFCACMYILNMLLHSPVETLDAIQWESFVSLEGLLGVHGEGWTVPQDAVVVNIEYLSVRAPNHGPTELSPYYHFVSKEWRGLPLLELNGTGQTVQYRSYQKSEFVRLKGSREIFVAVLSTGIRIRFSDPTIFKLLYERVGQNMSFGEIVLLVDNRHYTPFNVLLDMCMFPFDVLFTLLYISMRCYLG